MSYSPSFVSVHKRLAPAIPIGRFASYVNPQAIGFNSESDFYAPIQFSVQVANGVTGALRLDIATQKNSNWRSDMKDRLATTLGVSSSIELRTVTGKNLDQVGDAQLENVGKLNVYDAKTGKLIRLPALPSSVPPEYRATKVMDLHQWAQKLENYVPDVVAGVLKGKDKHEVEEALRIDGSVQKAIEDKIQNGASFGWNEFVRLHQSNSSKAQIPKEEAQKLLRKVSKQILTYVRSFVGAASEQVNSYIASEQAQKNKSTLLNKEDEHLLKPILSVAHAELFGKNKVSSSLYQTLVEDALSMPTLQKSLVASVYNFDLSAPERKSTTAVVSSVRPAMKRIVSAVSYHHPMNAHTHHTLLPLRGSYPADYIVRHTRQDMSAKAPFIGNATKVYEAYHKFSGAHAAPPPLRIKRGVIIQSSLPKLIPIESVQSSLPKLIPIESVQSSLPKLIPIDCTHPSKSKTHSRESSDEIEGLIQSSLPKLIPIDCSHTSRRKSHSRKSSDEIEGLIEGRYTSKGKKKASQNRGRRGSSSESSSDEDGFRKMGSAMPPLIPINAKSSSKAMPKLIPINADIEEDIQDEYSHLPSVDDVFI
jgi:hypothetical protein